MNLKFFRRYWRPKQTGVLFVELLDDDSMKLSFMRVSFKNGMFVPQFFLEEIEENHKEILNSIIPVCLIVEGKGIFHKPISITESDTRIELNKIFPNIKADDFYFQEYKNDSYVFYSIVRKTLLESIFNKFKNINFVKISLGHFEASVVCNSIKKEEFGIEIAGKKLHIRNNSIINYSNQLEVPIEEFSITISENIHVHNNQFSLYASVLNLYYNSNNDNFIFPSDPRIESSLQAQWSDYWYKYLLKASSICIFILVVVFSLCYFFLQDKNIKQINSLQKQQEITVLKKKELNQDKSSFDFFKNNNWNEFPVKTFCIDKIVSVIPKEITLTDILFNPILEVESQREMIPIYDQNIILITGTCTNAVYLNQWINSMKQYQWIKDNKVLSFSFNNITNVGLFKVKIVLE